MICKYIMLKEGPFTFPCAIEHKIFSDMAFKMKSAGFVEAKQGADGKMYFRCYGESKGLNLKSNPSDSDHMDVFFNLSVLAPKPENEFAPTSSLCN